MLVRQILNSKPSQEVATIAAGAPLAEAARILSERRIGALVVVDDANEPIGILSERDIVREVAASGAICLEKRVEEAMTRDVLTATPENRADEVLAVMTERRFRHMPVVEDGRMIGIISIGDVVKARLDELSMEREALTGMIMGS